MKAFSFRALAVLLLITSTTVADTLVLGSRTVTGTVLQTNSGNVLLMTDAGTLSYSLAIIREIHIDKAEAPDYSTTNRLPGSKSLIIQLSRRSWAGEIKQIPATVIDKGILKYVPYVSYRVGADYELNIYGDLDAPAGIELGMYHELASDMKAKINVVKFIASVVGQIQDRNIIGGLNPLKDLQKREGFTFEITPPSAEDSYGGWWLSIYSEQQLDLARASADEIRRISLSKDEAAKSTSANPVAWTAADMQQARPSAPLVNSVSPSSSSGSAGGYSSSGGGRVFVHSYTKKDGTYVESHYRSAPHRR